MQDWEVSLLADTRAFVKRLLPEMAPYEREEVVVKIYLKMRRTLKLLHRSRPPVPPLAAS